MFLARKKDPDAPPTAMAVLNAIGNAVIAVDAELNIRFANQAAEHLFAASAGLLIRHRLTDLVPPDSPVFSLIEQALRTTNMVAEYDLTLESPRIGRHVINVNVSPLGDEHGCVAICFEERSIAQKIDNQLTSRNAARSVTAMARMLAHEVKNPLSGIRGAAQLLEQTASEDDATLTRLICDETDRICTLLDRMEMFSDKPLDRGPVNIHSVLEHVRRVAENGFGRHVRFIEAYDPSLPPVDGNRDQLVQVFLNLVKNACEAVGESGGKVEITTRYQHGVRLAVAGHGERMHLPFVITITDNGEGVPEDLRRHLFDPFVTTKPAGSGLGLALVAKIVNDHGGVIEAESITGKGAAFRVMLPMYAKPRERRGNQEAQ